MAFTDVRVDLSDTQPPDRRSEAFAAVSGAIGASITAVRQVHGNRVLSVAEATDGVGQEADAMITQGRSLALAVRVADCVPVVFVDDAARMIGAAHAGRAGLLNGVLGATAAAMEQQGATGLRAWIGPHVCGACYEVPEAMAASFADATGIAPSRTRQGTTGIDLGAAARTQLADAGARVVSVEACTMHASGLHSHRRDGAAAGRGAGLVWLAS